MNVNHAFESAAVFFSGREYIINILTEPINTDGKSSIRL